MIPDDSADLESQSWAVEQQAMPIQDIATQEDEGLSFKSKHCFQSRTTRGEGMRTGVEGRSETRVTRIGRYPNLA
jgi:hypothetical protein